MIFCQKLIRRLRQRLQQKIHPSLRNKRGVALFIVLTAMATLAIFVGEITYTAQINQKLAYDRLDQIKATALAKSGLRLALLRIKAYTEIKKTIAKVSGGASAAAVNSVVPKDVLEKVWSEAITIPFSGDISGLPLGVRDALQKFRKDSSMEGKLYISIQSQSAKINLNSTVAPMAGNTSGALTPTPTPTPPPAPGQPVAPPGTTASPQPYDPEAARSAVRDQLKATFQQKFEDDPKFRDQYRNFRIDELADDIFGWSDLTFETQRSNIQTVPFKQAPFYNVSELHYLQSMDDEIYDLISPQFTASVDSKINVNMITDPVLAALLPQMTKEERQKFFDYREGKTDGTNSGAAPATNQDNSFKSADDFFKYIKEHTSYYGADARINDFKQSLTSRGIEIVTDESDFIVHIEATVQQTKRTLEANVGMESSNTGPTTPGTNPATGTVPVPTPPPIAPPGTNPIERSDLKITQLRFF